MLNNSLSLSVIEDISSKSSQLVYLAIAAFGFLAISAVTALLTLALHCWWLEQFVPLPILSMSLITVVFQFFAIVLASICCYHWFRLARQQGLRRESINSSITIDELITVAIVVPWVIYTVLDPIYWILKGEILWPDRSEGTLVFSSLSAFGLTVCESSKSGVV